MKYNICDECLKEINTDKKGPGQSYYICNKCSLENIAEYLQNKLNRLHKQPNINDKTS